MHFATFSHPPWSSGQDPRLSRAWPGFNSPWGRSVLGQTLNSIHFASLAQSVEHETFNIRAAGSSPAGGFLWINTIQQEQTNQTFLLFFGPYGIGVLRPILRERATFSTLNQTGICMWQQNKFCFRSSVGRACDS